MYYITYVYLLFHAWVFASYVLICFYVMAINIHENMDDIYLLYIRKSVRANPLQKFWFYRIAPYKMPLSWTLFRSVEYSRGGYEDNPLISYILYYPTYILQKQHNDRTSSKDVNIVCYFYLYILVFWKNKNRSTHSSF